jgi:hypothetical protein
VRPLQDQPLLSFRDLYLLPQLAWSF